jgi:hypothetical protein
MFSTLNPHVLLRRLPSPLAIMEIRNHEGGPVLRLRPASDPDHGPESCQPWHEVCRDNSTRFQSWIEEIKQALPTRKEGLPEPKQRELLKLGLTVEVIERAKTQPDPVGYLRRQLEEEKSTISQASLKSQPTPRIRKRRLRPSVVDYARVRHVAHELTRSFLTIPSGPLIQTNLEVAFTSVMATEMVQDQVVASPFDIQVRLDDAKSSLRSPGSEIWQIKAPVAGGLLNLTVFLTNPLIRPPQFRRHWRLPALSVLVRAVEECLARSDLSLAVGFAATASPGSLKAWLGRSDQTTEPSLALLEAVQAQLLPLVGYRQVIENYVDKVLNDNPTPRSGIARALFSLSRTWPKNSLCKARIVVHGSAGFLRACLEGILDEMEEWIALVRDYKDETEEWIALVRDHKADSSPLDGLAERAAASDRPARWTEILRMLGPSPLPASCLIKVLTALDKTANPNWTAIALVDLASLRWIEMAMRLREIIDLCPPGSMSRPALRLDPAFRAALIVDLKARLGYGSTSAGAASPQDLRAYFSTSASHGPILFPRQFAAWIAYLKA